MNRKRSRHLFSDDQLSDVVELRRRKITNEIGSLDPNYVLNANREELCDYFAHKYRFNMPVLDTDNVCFEQDEANIDVSQDFRRLIYERSKPFFLKGTRITFVIPFEGDPALFKYRPSSFTTILPLGDVRENELRLEYESVDHDEEAIKNAFSRSLREVQQYLGFVEENVTRFNSSFVADVRRLIDDRREKLLKDQGLAASLGFPMRKRDGIPQTYSVPVTRRALPIQLPKATTEPFRPEPALEMQGYEQILGTISNMSLVLERSPQAFAGMKEEDLRTHFLVGLNGQFEGQATAETFNCEGKTDILIRCQGRNIFIAECKFWTGEKGLSDAVDQLLGYASWRDTKTAILLFNRNKNLTAVLTKAVNALTKHESFLRQVDYPSETGFRFVLKQKNDPNREIILTVLVFDVPVNNIEENDDATIQ